MRGYAEAILDPSQDVSASRSRLIDAVGEEAMIQAASVVASFDGINRVADATGIRLDPESSHAGAQGIIEALELESLGAARA